MQNPIAALMMPTVLAEAASSPASVEPGDGSFAETFVESGNASEPELRSDGAAGSDFVVPLSWPTAVAPRTAFLASTGASAEIDMDPAAWPVLAAGSNASFEVVDSESLGSVLDQRAGLDTSGNGSAQSSVDSELSAAQSESELSLAAVVGPVPSDNTAELPVAKSETDARLVLLATPPGDLAAFLPTITPASEPKPNSDKPGAHGSKQAAAGRSSTEDAATVAQPESIPVPGGDAPPLPVGQQTLATVVSAQPNVPVKLPGQMTVQPQSDSHQIPLLGHASLEHVPLTWQMGPPEVGTVEVTISQVSHRSSVAGVGLELQIEEPSDLAPDMTSGPSHEMSAEPREISSSFWERYFSDPSISVPDHVRTSASGVSPSGVFGSLLTSVFPVLAETSEASAPSLTRSDPQLPAGVFLKGPDEALKPYRILPETAAAPTATTGDFVGIAQAGMVIAGWEEDLARLGDGADLLQSHGLASSARASAGFSMSPPGLPALPVQHVASQLAEVLIRSPGTVTELALSPEELGHVRLRMEPDAANPDRLLILISVERPETLELFRRHAGELAEAIRSAGYSGADIGFGQNGKEGSPDQRHEPPSAGPHLPFDETSRIEPTRMMAAGASLDLRL